MDYSIKLQDPYSDSIKWALLLLGILLAAAFFLVLFWWMNARSARTQKENSQPSQAPQSVPSASAEQLKNAALTELMEIENSYCMKKLNVREASMRISLTVRSYLASVTDGNADCRTLSELAGWKKPELTRLIGFLYGAEFSEMSSADAQALFRDARKLVAQWK